MGMTNEDAKKMLEAKLKCFIAETSGTNHDCNMRLCEGCALNYEQGNMGEQKQALDMAIKALEQQPRWIPVSERLPETDGVYLTYIVNLYDIKLSYIMICDYIHPKWFPIDETASSNVVAWMPLPEPYRESEE